MSLRTKKSHLWVGGVKVTVCVCLLSLGPYKKYGTSVTVHASYKTRRRAHLRVAIVNDYFRKRIDDARPDYIHMKRDEISSSAKHKTTLSLVNNKENTEPEVAGIYSHCLIRLNGEEINEKVINGEVPPDFTSSLKPHF